MVDANHAYDAMTAIRLGRLIEPCDIAWFEEPVVPESLDGYREVRAALRIPIAGGEAECTRFGFRDLITRRCVDILQPDICACGGFTEAARIGALAAGGEIVISAQTLDASQPRAPAANPRTVNLKGISEPVTVYTLQWQ